MGQTYSVSFENSTYTNADGDRDLFYLAPADDRGIRILGLFIANVGADVGDAEEEMIRLSVIRGHTTVGSGGAAATPRPMSARYAAAGATARVNDTTIASSGTTVTLHADGWNIRSPYGLILPDAMQWRCDQGQTSIVVRAHTTPADDISISGTLYFEAAN